MNFILVLQYKFCCLSFGLCLISMVSFSVSFSENVTFSISPSSVVDVNQTVTLQCDLDPNPLYPIVVRFKTTAHFDIGLCELEPNNGVCLKPCRDNYTALCPNNTQYSIEVTVPRNWSGVALFCQTNYGRSNYVNIYVKVPVTSVNIHPQQIEVVAEQKMNLTCTTSESNPAANITWFMSTVDITNQSTFTIEQRDRLSKTISSLQKIAVKKDNGKTVYCKANNTLNKYVTSTELVLKILYKPEVSSNQINQYTVREGGTASLVCTLIDANPKTPLTWKWIKLDSNDTVYNNGPNFTMSNITRRRSGSYSCAANNSVGTSNKVTVTVDVQYPPSISRGNQEFVNETETVVLSREIISNPLSNVSWYNGTQLLQFNSSVKISNFTIRKAMCTDTRNFTIVASNIIQLNVTSQIELLVNCRPRVNDPNITLGVTDATGIEFSTTVIAFPKPQYSLEYENGTKNKKMISSLKVNAVNMFTLHFNQTLIEQEDFGTYYLHITNALGNTTVLVNVIPERTPDRPRNVQVVCEVTSALVQWTSSFNGGNPQSFIANALDSGQRTLHSESVPDKGKNEAHYTYIHNLQPSTQYFFFVSAKNIQGFVLSENKSCTTSSKASDNSMSLIAGGATAGGVTLAVIVIAAVIFLRRLKKQEKGVRKSKRLHNDEDENEDVHDDGLKENVLYISAGPRDDEKPDGAVYAAVVKKNPEGSSNTNVYAEVKKDEHQKKSGTSNSNGKAKKGLGKKDAKSKTKKGQKQESKMNEADVYENAEDIAMTVDADKTYSNTKGRTTQEQVGYKNKDGLLYVDVKFDTKQGQENPVIHGQDEKTEYATVEFPMKS